MKSDRNDINLIYMPHEVENVLVLKRGLFTVNVSKVDWGTLQDVEMFFLLLFFKKNSVRDFKAQNIKCVDYFGLSNFM